MKVLLGLFNFVDNFIYTENKNKKVINLKKKKLFVTEHK